MTTQGSPLQASERMRDLVRHKNWAQTPLGPAEQWPHSLKMLVELCLASKFPSVIFWGPQRIQIYNDGYRVILGAKHPQALGQSAADCWAEIWSVISPMMDKVFSSGEAVWIEATQFSVERNGYLEEAYFTFSYTPAVEESGAVGGIFETVAEVTEQVLAHRRLALLRQLAEPAMAANVEEACAMSAAILAQYPYDLPFALLYRLEADALTATLCAQAGLPDAPSTIVLGRDDCWQFQQALLSTAPLELTPLPAVLSNIVGQPWPEPCRSAVIMPIAQPGGGTYAFFVAGISPRRRLDDAYRDFLRLASQQIARVVSAADAFQRERRRAEDLAALDQAKTQFFNNVSHELRTPLTLILGPVRDAFALPVPVLDGEALLVVHRSAVRLMRMVNSLLDFSRLEAGRMQTRFVAVDLAALTLDLTSTFRSLLERAGLVLQVDCQLSAPAYVDVAQWEKVVFNLLSNAFKFTLQGSIRVELHEIAHQIEFSVSDTGCGIPTAELPHMFERFHRVAGASGRSFEGSGIGLSLVREFARLHGGQVEVDSVLGQGSRFTVRLPMGKAHLPSERVFEGEDAPSCSASSEQYVLEAMPWVDDVQETPSPAPQTSAETLAIAAAEARVEVAQSNSSIRILVVDDNADMRRYLARILSAHWQVQLAEDGEVALRLALEQPPNLVLSDVMMPRLNGIELLRALRATPATRDIPVLLLSARAGEEALLEGIGTGADDYLVKPFSARELVARVQTHLNMSLLRRQWARELERANAELEAFSYSASHDLRAPLREIDGFGRALLTQAHAKLNDQERYYLDHIRKGTQRMGNLIDDLLKLAQITRASLYREQVDLSELARKIVAEAREGNPERQVDIHVTDGLTVRADSRLLSIALVNLIGNAWKYTGKQAQARIDIGMLKQANEHIYYVRDNGAGFDMRYVHKLFAPFQRLHSVSEFEGTGVGLATVQRIVARHGGRIWAEAAPGQGATFFFTIGEAA